ncbi:MAG: hypothetical protein WCO56_21335 [Verrucomicrobiota bacterium]
MNCARFLLTALLLTAFKAAAQTQWVTAGPDGKLRYQSTGTGDRLLDFSHAGYGGGGIKLPTVPVRQEISPSGSDDSAAIQAAINAVATMPLTEGFRGAVLLRPGVFHCAQPLTLAQDGIVLRGSGSGKGGTVIEMTGPPHVCLAITGERLRYPKENPAALIPIADAYVPSGALSISVKEPKGLAVGDVIRIRWPRTAKWIHFMEMDNLVRNGKPQTWMKNDSPILFERTIRVIQGNRLTLDVPLTDAIDSQFLAPTTAGVIKTAAPKRLGQCGIESLRINSPPPSGTLTAKNNLAIELENCEDCWVKDIAMHNTLGNVDVGAAARRITILNAHAVHTATVDKGAGYPADFLLKGSQVLIDRCSSSGAGSFYVATLNSEAVLNVALHCAFEGTGSIQPHMHWSTGLLVDSCRLPDGRIEFINRRTAGSGHGWAIGWAVAWNCSAKVLELQQPPGAVNWCIGCTGELKKSASPTGPWLASLGRPVLPTSLYLAQLRERLGENALKNIGY